MVWIDCSFKNTSVGITVYYQVMNSEPDTTDFFPENDGEPDVDWPGVKPERVMLYNADDNNRGMFIGTVDQMIAYDKATFPDVEFEYFQV